MASRRLMKERSQLEQNPLDGCHIEVDENDLSQWKVYVTGPSGTPYAGGTFLVTFSFPAQYPFKAPTLKFETKIYHPSVETSTGEICADILANGWGPTLNVRHCLNTLLQMLIEPSADHFLSQEIATQLREKPKEFEKNAKKYTKEYARA